MSYIPLNPPSKGDYKEVWTVELQKYKGKTVAREIKFNRPHKTTANSWDYEQALVRALYERDRFLEMYPQYMDFQCEIDHMLNKAGSTENRMTVLAMLMEKKLDQLSRQFQKLSGVLLENETVSD